MEIDQSVLKDLPGEVVERILGLVRDMWSAVVVEACSPSQAEERVAALSRQVGLEVLSEGLSRRHGRQSGPRRDCECGRTQRFEGYRVRVVTTIVGLMRFRRAYYRCGECGATHYAGEEALGLGAGRYTLPAQEAIALACSEAPFERAQLALRRLAGVEVSLSHAQAVSEGHGAQMREQREEVREKLFDRAFEYEPEKRDHRLYVTLDATKTRFVDEWHETRVGAVYDAKPGADGLDEPGRTTYVTAVQARVEDFGRALYQEAARRGVAAARETVVVADGAPWIWNLAAEHYPGATEILDFYHASERLHAVSRAVYGEGTARAKTWAKRNVTHLGEGEWKRLLCSLKSLRPSAVDGREALRKAIGYFETNRHRMNYPAYRARGLHIGSGVVEAACKGTVGSRCKRPGMRWTKAGAENILSLRCELLNDRWDEYWQPLKAAA